jgi:hypothetical protein
MGSFALHPAAYQTRAERDQEDAHGVANKLTTLAQRILDAAEAIYGDAVAGDFACDWSPARLEALQQDMETMTARLQALRRGDVA